jgi:hypothetical protein
VAVPVDGEEDSVWYIVVGLMPLAEIISDTQRKR